MKSQNFLTWTLGLALGILPFAGGCLQQENQSPSVQNAAAITPVAYQTPAAEPAEGAAENEAAPALPPEAMTNAPALADLANAEVQPLSTNLTAPAKVQLTAAAAELARMANSGVDEKVMLTYVTNSPSTFNLDADAIIYLNDLGVPGTVVTAMIQRDQALRGAGAAAMAESARANAQQPPVVQAQPSPADVAPQAMAPPPSAPVEAPLSPPEGDVTAGTFYEPLSPYGNWVYVSGYGRCWRPTVAVVNPGWEPYFDGGRWVYTDYGWYWVSDYSWGWAPFHYGRWFRHNHWGWCWAPDTVWGPSWVSWRYNDAYCGWAPLPPGAYFSFGIGLTFYGHRVHDWDGCGLGPGYGHYVRWDHFHNHGLHAYAVGAHERPAIYRNTTIVNNITVNNNTVINRGVPRDRVAAVTHRDVRPVTLRETGGTARPAGGRPEQLRGNTLTVYRPVMPQTTSTQTRAAGGSSHSRPELGNRAGNSASSASAPSSGVVQTPERRSGQAVPGQTRQGTALSRSDSRTTQPLQSPAATTRDARAPVTRQSGAGMAGGAPQTTARPEPSATRAPSVTRTAQPAPAQPPTYSNPRSAPPYTRSEAPGRNEPAARSTPPPAAPYQAPSRAPASNPRSSATPTYSPAPTYTAPQRSATATTPPTPQRSYNAPSTPAPQRSYTAASAVAPQRSYTPPSTPVPQRSYTGTPAGTREAVSVPRYTPAPSQPNYSPAPQRSYSPPSTPAPQRSYTPAPSYSRPAPSVSESPRYSAPPAPSAPRASAPVPQPAPSRSSSSDSRGGDNGGGRSRSR